MHNGLISELIFVTFLALTMSLFKLQLQVWTLARLLSINSIFNTFDMSVFIIFFMILWSSFEIFCKQGVAKASSIFLKYSCIWDVLLNFCLEILCVMGAGLLLSIKFSSRNKGFGGAWSLGPWKSNGAFVKFYLRAQWTPENRRICNVFLWRDPPKFAWGL